MVKELCMYVSKSSEPGLELSRARRIEDACVGEFDAKDMYECVSERMSFICETSRSRFECAAEWQSCQSAAEYRIGYWL